MKGRVLITGASSGIGRDLARLFARDGHDLVLVSRSLAKLESVAAELRREAAGEVKVLPADLGRAGAATALLRALESQGIRVDILVNNAGVGVSGPFLANDLAAELAMMRLHMDAAVELAKGLLPGMVARRAGGILTVASTAAFQPGPGMAVYHATKAFLLFFSEALRWELRGTGVAATVLCPGPTRTGFLGAMGKDEPPLVGKFFMPSRRAAEAGYRAFARARGVAVPGLWNYLGALGARLAPRDLVLRVTGRFLALVKPLSPRPPSP